ncbi:extracellular tyrosine-protein kinase PKDCC [Microcaecilia unicolor]|uniref:Extracellular tyrosine-protein kinase PKDCC n=1 Tax=Microcaecilia unicolor TaxID=1415580 RepID=A0A6P7Z1U8_9AMPH|nr:extracellular tyrosine-protein kinase PKDCC-like [Microcaecilia unicolor]
MQPLGTSLVLGAALFLGSVAFLKLRSPGNGGPAGLLRELRARQRDLSLYSAAGSREWVPARLGCADLASLSRMSYVGSGFSKVVWKGRLADGRDVALKLIHREGSDMRRCLKLYGDPEGCQSLATYKLLKEVTLLKGLRHPGIIQLYGECYDNRLDPGRRVTALLELGSPLEIIQLLQTPWEERFKVCLSLVRLLHFLAHSPLGSVALLDFQPRQFVTVDGDLKVTDLDDASTEELTCSGDADCVLEFPTKSFSLTCAAAGRCEGINEKRNLYNAYRYFFTYLLPYTAPPALKPFLFNIMNATGDLRYGINETLEAFEKVLYLYKSGLHLPKRSQPLKEYQILKGLRLQEAEDYKCWPSYSHLGCLLSIHNADEAAEICSSNPQCQSFTIGERRMWTGRHLATFRSTFTDLIPDANSTVYVRRSSAWRKR